MNRYELLARLREDNKYFYIQENQYSKRNKKNMDMVERDGKQVITITPDKKFFLFLDTCTWLNQAKDGKFENFIKLADLALQLDISLLLPEQLTVEWNRNKEETVYKETERTIGQLISKTQSLRDRVITDGIQKQHLTDLIAQAERFKEEQGRLLGGQTIALVEEILDLGKNIPTDDRVLIQAAQAGLANVKPFATNKNSTGDAVLFFSLMNYLEGLMDQGFVNPVLYFVTDNKDDFSEKKQGEEMNTMHSHFIDYASQKGIEIRYYYNKLENALDHIIDEVTDDDYIAECERLYQEQLANRPKCDACGEPKFIDYHEWDGRGRKMFYRCSVCLHIEETNTYDIDAIHDNYF